METPKPYDSMTPEQLAEDVYYTLISRRITPEFAAHCARQTMEDRRRILAERAAKKNQTRPLA